MRAERKRKVRRGRFIRARECRSRFYIIRWCLVRLLCWHDWRVCSTFVMSTKAKLLLQPVWKPQERDRPRCYNKELKLHESVKPTSPAIFWENVEFFFLLFNWVLCVGFNWLYIYLKSINRDPYFLIASDQMVVWVGSNSDHYGYPHFPDVLWS